MLRLYDPRTGRAEEISPARTGVVRIACSGGLRPLLVADLIRRLLTRHRVRAIGIWAADDVAADLGVRPAELSSGEADVHIGETVAPWSSAAWDGEHTIDPLGVRLAFLRTHYRNEAALDRAALAEAGAALEDLRRRVAGWADAPGRPLDRAYVDEAVAALDADLDTPAVFTLLDRLADDTSVPPGAKFETAIEIDMILGVDLVRLVGRL